MSEENKRIYLASPHMGGLEEVFVKEAFDTNWIAPLGANVDGFEKELSEYVGSKTGAALASGTAAIHMALKAVGVKKGDKVFCSSLTFAASCNPIIYEGGIPVFIDSEPESHNMSPVALEKAFKAYEEKGEMPKAVIVVNLYGQSADMDKIIEICKKYNIPIIEDAAESLGATYKGKHSGTFGEYGIYSFNGNKIITTSGGGMLVSNNEEGIAKVRFWSTQARDKARHYEHTELGYNYRMSNICAGIGRGQMEVLDAHVQLRRDMQDFYLDLFQDIAAVKVFTVPNDDYYANYWLSAILIEPNTVKGIDRESLRLAFDAANIESRPLWKPMHLQPIFSNYPYYGSNIAETLFEKGLCLPSGSNLTDEERVRIKKVVLDFFK